MSAPKGSTRRKKKPPTGGPTSAQFIMDDVKLLLADVTAPESDVKFNVPSRADTDTLRNSINPPDITWRWADAAGRTAQVVSVGDVGKYGIQSDTNGLFQLTNLQPPVWQPVGTAPGITWTWLNQSARQTQAVTASDIGKRGIQTDIATIYQLIGATPAVWQAVPNSADTSPPLGFSTGASDADSYHDFYRLQIAFEDVWSQLLNSNIQVTGEKLYAQWNALLDTTMDDSGAPERLRRFPTTLPPGQITTVDELLAFLAFIKAELGLDPGAGPSGMAATPLMAQMASALGYTLYAAAATFDQEPQADGFGPDDNWRDSSITHNPQIPAAPNDNPSIKTRRDFINAAYNRSQELLAAASAPPVGPPPPNNPALQNLLKLLGELDAMLREKYKFDVFAPDSVNYGLLLNYRQHWHPQSYQVGSLVSSIPLAPQETRRYTTRTVVKRTRNVKEIDDALRTSRDERSDTARTDAEVVDRARNQTSFQKNVSGSFGNDALYKVSAGMQNGQDQAVESAQTKREFRESVVKASQEYRNEHRVEITTEESTEQESTTYQEIRNPNDELTVTYLFYELQRRYLVDEALHKVTPVVLVANDVPAPHEVDQGWLLRHDWIIRRTILDHSFLPALDYLSANYTGAEVTLQVLQLSVEQQKAVVDRISGQVSLANNELSTATLGLEQSENQEVTDLQNAETVSIVKSFFDPLGITKSGSDGNSDRARVDFAKDALNRAQTKVNQLVAQLKTETTALHVAIDKYTAAATTHFNMLAEIDRLRIHVKDNLIYYMQAIWTYEPADQRYFRLYNIDVPTFTHNTAVPVSGATGLAQIDQAYKTIEVYLPTPTLDEATAKLHQVADLENLLGFKGNYMIFPLVNFNYMTWFMMQDYIHIDDNSGVTAQDPDPLSDVSIEQMKAAMKSIYANDPASFEKNQSVFEEIMLRLLAQQGPEMVVVPSKSLYIEALPGTHPLLEDFKLIHRAIDVKKAQAEVRHAELENLRLASRLANDDLGDPDIDKVVVVGSGQNVTVDAGQ